MIGDIAFYRMRGSLSSGEYPLLSTGQNLSSYLVATVPRCKYRGGLQTIAEVPVFEGYDVANIAKIGDDWYWVTEYREKTAEGRQFIFTLDYMAPTSLLKRGESHDMYLTRSPTYLCDYLSDDFSGAVTELSDVKQLGNIIDDPLEPTESLYWVQITCLFELTQTNEYRRYGCFVVAEKDSGISDVYIDASAYRNAQGETYPSLSLIMNHPDSIVPTTAAGIQDISISRRCPYKFKFESFTSGAISGEYIALADANGNAVPTGQDQNAPRMYFIDNLVNNETIQGSWKNHVFSTSSAAKMIGKLTIRDWNKNRIVTFPLAQGNTLKVQTYADLSGIYTIIDNGYQRVSVPEGRLPWNGSAWEEYKAYQMAADRQVLINAQEYARFDFNTRDVAGGVQQFGGAINNMIFGAIAGKGAGAIAGGIGGALNMWASSYENKRGLELALMQATDNFELTQKRAQDARGTAFSVGYGLIYVALTTEANDLIAGVELPLVTNSSALLQAYTDRVGWPCEGRQTVQIVNGYYKGMIPATATLNGMKFDQLNVALGQGYKFVDP